MAVVKQQPAPVKYTQGMTDEEYRRKYGTGSAATSARVAAVMQHRGRTPNAARIADIVKRRSQEFNTRGYGALRDWAGPPTNPAQGKGGGVTEKKKPTLEEARAKALKDAIAAIGAQYGMQAGEMNLQQTQLGNTWRQQNADIVRQTDQMQRQTTEDAVRRGIGRSSIYAQNMGDVLGEEARAKSQLAQEFGTTKTTGKQGTRARQIESAMKLLGQQRAMAIQQAKSQSAKGELDLETLIALIGTGIAGTNFAQA